MSFDVIVKTEDIAERTCPLVMDHRFVSVRKDSQVRTITWGQGFYFEWTNVQLIFKPSLQN